MDVLTPQLWIRDVEPANAEARYDGAALRLRSAEAAVRRHESLLRAARDQGEPVQAAEYEWLLGLHHDYLDSVRPAP